MMASASRTSRACASIALAGSLLSGCGTSSSPSTPTKPTATPTVTALTVVEPKFPTMTGGTTQLVATATLSDGRKVTTGFNVQWASTNQEIAIVNSSGFVKTLKPGTVTIEATSGTLKATATIRVITTADWLHGLVSQAAPKEEPVMTARLTVVGGVYDGRIGLTDPFGKFVLDVVGVVRVHVSAPYFQDTEMTLDSNSPALIRLTPVAGMIIDGTAGFGGGDQKQLTFSQRSTGPAHLTVGAYMSDYSGFERFCGELRDDANRVLWQVTSRAYEESTTLTLTGGRSYALKVYDCTPAPAPKYGMGRYVLRSEHM